MVAGNSINLSKMKILPFNRFHLNVIQKLYKSSVDLNPETVLQTPTSLIKSLSKRKCDIELLTISPMSEVRS